MGSLAKLHVLCIPYPVQGHIKPMLQLAMLLHAQGCHITFVHTEYNYRRMLRAQLPESIGLERFKFETIPDGLPHSDADVTQDIPSLCRAVMDDFLEPFKELLSRINDPSSLGLGLGPVNIIVSDSTMYFTLEAAREVGDIPLVWLWTASVCGFLGYLQFQGLLDRNIIPFKDESYLTDGTLDKPLDWVPSSLLGIQLKYLPSFLRITDTNEPLFNILKISAETTANSSLPILFNTFDSLDSETLIDSSKLVTGPMYTIGPLQSLVPNKLPQSNPVKIISASLWKEDKDIFKWLDSKKPRSVIYASFGSITTMSNDNLVEFAWGLANSGCNFIWVVRPGLVTGDKPVIPVEFVSEIKERGLITSWCDQENVLKHESVGVFLTHCGWNSTLDFVCGGVPVLCWPFFADQQTNCWFSCGKWGVGMEIDSEVKRGPVERQVWELIDGEKGGRFRRNVMDRKKLAEEAVGSPNGSSFLNLDKFINEVLLPLKRDGSN